jgi:putative membrane protein
LLVLAYVGMGYLAWTLALVILGQVQSSLVGLRVLTVPLIAAAVMVSWDFSMDPVWSTIEHAWIWVKGGAYFGVPVSNFLGWYFTFYVIYQLFALYLRGRPTATKSLASVDWRLAIVFYGVSAAGNLLLAVPRRGISVVTDSAGVQWRVSGITGACAVASIFTMGAFVVLAWARLKNQ